MPKSHIVEFECESRVTEPIKLLVQEFLLHLSVSWKVPTDLADAADRALAGCTEWEMYPAAVRKRRLFGLVNSKLRTNRDGLQLFLDAAAARRIFPNYREKGEILSCLDHNDFDTLRVWLQTKGYDSDLANFFKPVGDSETLAILHEQLRTGTVTRRDARRTSVGERKDEVLRALFGSYAFSSFPSQAMHAHFNADCNNQYLKDFYQHLLRFHPKALDRNCALIFLVIDETVRAGLSATALRDQLCTFVAHAYERLSNQCFLAILIRPFKEGAEDGKWRLFSDLTLYAEKHREVALKTGYFRPHDVERDTATYISKIDLKAANFRIANEGFFFRDCIVLLEKGATSDISTSSSETDLLLLFEKNERDERPIPCPACRSLDVRGNSYPTLGVRSWECQNPICPNRSAFDRGNRYSVASIIKQEAIGSEENQIPKFSLRRWKLDVVAGVDEQSLADMLVRHFSLHSDSVALINSQCSGLESLGRKISFEPFTACSDTTGRYEAFLRSSFFKRFIIDRDLVSKGHFKRVSTGIPGVEVYRGDCFEVLAEMESSSIDGATTSPPYYNARSYTVWPNIYCYLYDMYNSARQVFRVLKPGAIYLFNIFDYFDNENNIVSSAMGKKRMILGAYVINIFRRAGFELVQNVVWYKGEIEGKRNFNQGNMSPYYQFPLNCWEHVLAFRKPGARTCRYRFPTVLSAKPVIKMVSGKNVLGHSAPFPQSVPNVLLSQLQNGDVVLDPFSGSMTTGRLAYRYGLKSISIDLHQEFCDLGLRLLREEEANLELFA
jgi:DNA modification methylase